MGNSYTQPKLIMPARTIKLQSKIMFYGDSLTEGPYISKSNRYTSVFQTYVNMYGLNWEVVNAGKNGDTISGSMPRLQSELDKHNPRIVCLCLGANDLFQGAWQRVDDIKAQLVNMIMEIRRRGMTVILIGMLPPFDQNILDILKLLPEADKRLNFFNMYEQIANEQRLPYIASIFQELPLQQDSVLLTNMANGNFSVRDMFQGNYFVDIVHPNAKGHAIIGRYLFACIKPFLS